MNKKDLGESNGTLQMFQLYPFIPVDVPAEVYVQVFGARLERLADHDESQGGPHNPDVDDGGDRLARGALPLPRLDFLGEVPDACEGAVDVGHGVLPVDQDRRVQPVLHSTA